MAEYVQCKDCDNCNSDVRDGYRWYCDYYNIFVDPDEVSDCPHFRD